MSRIGLAGCVAGVVFVRAWSTDELPVKWTKSTPWCSQQRIEAGRRFPTVKGGGIVLAGCRFFIMG
jgi:hypothetical protein